MNENHYLMLTVRMVERLHLPKRILFSLQFVHLNVIFRLKEYHLLSQTPLKGFLPLSSFFKQGNSAPEFLKYYAYTT